MSIDLMTRVWWRTDLPTMVKFVALALADAADEEGSCWPAVDTIAIKCSCSSRTVQNALRDLEERGMIDRRARTDRSSFYRFRFSALPHIDRPRRAKEKMIYAGTGAGDSGVSRGTGESGSMTGESGSMTGAGDSPRTINEPSIETSESPLPPVPGEFASGELVLYQPDESLSGLIESGWAALTEEYPQFKKMRGGRLHDGRARRAKKLFSKNPAQTAIEVQELFARIRAQPFLQGDNDRGWVADIDWLMNSTNFNKVMEGKYERTGDKAGVTSAGPNAVASGMRAMEIIRAGRARSAAGEE